MRNIPKEKSTTFRYLNRPLLFTVFLLLPALIWIFCDNDSWRGDTTGYATKIIYLYNDFKCCKNYWFQTMWEGYRAPFILWIGQLFVPLGIIVKNLKAGLLLMPFLSTLLTTYCTFQFLKVRFQNHYISLTGTILTASSPFLFGYTLGFWIEPLQVGIISFLLYSTIKINKRSFFSSISILLIIICLAQLIKVSTIAYMVAPALYFIYKTWRNCEKKQILREDYKYIIPALFVFIITTAFYVYNFNSLVNFATFSFSSDLYSIEISKTKYGISKIIYGIFTWPTYTLFLVLVIISVIKSIKQKKLYDVLFWMSATQLIIFIPLWIKSPNSDPRFILPNLPYFVILFCWALNKLDNQKINIIVLIVACLQYFTTIGYSYDVIKISSPQPMIRPLRLTPSKEYQELKVISQYLVNDNTVLLDLEPDIYLTDLELELLNKNISINWRDRCMDINRLINIHLHQIDDNSLKLDDVWANFINKDPDYFITRPCRIVEDIPCTEMARTDKYDQQTITIRKQLVQKIEQSGMYKKLQWNNNIDLVIFEKKS